MGRVIVIDNSARFVTRMELAADQALGRAGAEIELLAKSKVPVKQGPLQSSGQHRRVGLLHHRVVFNKEYAAYQERGARRDGSHPVRKYTTPGTGAHYLENAGKTVMPKVRAYLKSAMPGGRR